MEEFYIIGEEINSEFSQDISDMEIWDSGMKIWFRGNFRKRHFTIKNMLEEIFDFRDLTFDIMCEQDTKGLYGYDEDSGTWRIVLLIELSPSEYQ